MQDAHPPQQYDDPLNDGARDVVRGAVTLATLLEAGARATATVMQQQAARKEREAGDRHRAARMQRHADQLTRATERDRLKLASLMDLRWLETASFSDAAWAWRTATVEQQPNEFTARVSWAARERLYQLQPDLMDAYDAARAAGRTPRQAMEDIFQQWKQKAGQENDVRPQPSAHATPWPSMWGPPLAAGDVAAFDEAVRAEVAILAEDLDPDAIAAIQQLYRDQQQLPAATGLDLLKQICHDLVEQGGPPEVTAAEHNTDEEVFAAKLLAGAYDRDGRTSDGRLPAAPPDPDPDQAGESAEVAVTGPVLRAAAPPRRPAAAQAFPLLRISPGAAAAATKRPVIAYPANTRTPAVTR